MAKATEEKKQKMMKSYQENREQRIEDMKNYHENNKVKIHLRKQKYYQLNKEKILQKSKSIERPRKTHTFDDVDKIIKLRARKYSMKLKSKLPQECGICHSNNNLEIHHWRYDKPYKNRFNLLCQTCHKIQHIKHFETSVFGGQ